MCFSVKVSHLPRSPLITDVLSVFVAKFMGQSVDRKCWQSTETDGCAPFSKESPVEIPEKRDLGRRRNAGGGNSGHQRHTREEFVPDMSEGIPDFVRNITSTEKPDVKPTVSQKGTVCFCDTDLCNEAGGSYLQNAGSAYFTVICVLTLTVLMTLSAADDDEN